MNNTLLNEPPDIPPQLNSLLIPSSLTELHHQSSTTQHLHQSLLNLVHRIRQQLQILSIENKHKSKQIMQLEEEIQALQKLLSNNTENKQQLKLELQKYNIIQEQLLDEISNLRNEKLCLQNTFNDNIEKYRLQFNEEKNMQSKKIQKELEEKLQIISDMKINFEFIENENRELMENQNECLIENKSLQERIQTLEKQKQNLTSMNIHEREQMERKLDSLENESQQYVENMNSMQDTMVIKDQELNEIGQSLIHLQTKINGFNHNKKQIAILHQKEIEELQQQILQYKQQTLTLQSTVDSVIGVSSQESKNEIFWGIDQNGLQLEEDIISMETLVESVDEEKALNTNGKLRQLRALPNKIISLEQTLQTKEHELQLKTNECLLANNEVKEQREMTVIAVKEWRMKTKELEVNTLELKLRAENLEESVYELGTSNMELHKENEKLKSDVHNYQQTTSAHEIYLQMKNEEEINKLNEMYEQISILQKELQSRNLVCNKLEKQWKISKNTMEENELIYNKEILILNEKLQVMSHVSQHEIQTAYNISINELQSLIDMNIPRHSRSTSVPSSLPTLPTVINESTPMDTPHPRITNGGNTNDNKLNILAPYIVDANEIPSSDTMSDRHTVNSAAVAPVPEDRSIRAVSVCSSASVVSDKHNNMQTNIVTIVEDDDDNHSVKNNGILTANVEANQSRASEEENDAVIIDKDDAIASEVVLEVVNNLSEFFGVREQIPENEMILHSLSPMRYMVNNRAVVEMGNRSIFSFNDSVRAHDGSNDGSVRVIDDDDDRYSDDEDLKSSADVATHVTVNSNAIQSMDGGYSGAGDGSSHGIGINRVLTADHVSYATEEQNIYGHDNNLLTIVDEILNENTTDDMSAIIKDNPLLGPFVFRQRHHTHNVHENEEVVDENMKEILLKAKSIWSTKLETIVANSDSWFINEDGDIVVVDDGSDGRNVKDADNSNVDEYNSVQESVVDETGNGKLLEENKLNTVVEESGVEAEIVQEDTKDSNFLSFFGIF